MRSRRRDTIDAIEKIAAVWGGSETSERHGCSNEQHDVGIGRSPGVVQQDKRRGEELTNEDEELRAKVELYFEGVAPAAKTSSYVMYLNKYVKSDECGSLSYFKYLFKYVEYEDGRWLQVQRPQNTTPLLPSTLHPH